MIFNGWGQSWGQSWIAGEVDPSATSGSASFSINSSATVAAIGHASGSASFSITGNLALPVDVTQAYMVGSASFSITGGLLVASDVELNGGGHKRAWDGFFDRITRPAAFDAPLSAASVDIPAVPTDSTGMQFVQSVELAPNHYLTLVDPAQAAINLATKEVPTYGTQTAQTVQAAQEGQQLAQQATPLNLRDDELALLLILLEATA